MIREESFRQKPFEIQVTDRAAPELPARRDPVIFFVLEGRLEAKVENRSFRLEDTDFILVNSEERCGLHFRGPGLLGVLQLKYNEVSEYLELRDQWIRCCSLLENPALHRAERHIRNIFGYFLSTGTSDEALLLAEFYRLLRVLRENFREKKKLSLTEGHGGEEERLERIRTYLTDHFDRKISLEELAEETYLSTTYLSKYIKKHFGKNFSEVLLDIRLQRAEQALRESDLPITRISMDCGFPLPAAFNKAFRERYGLTPTEYRRKSEGEEEREEEYRSRELEDRISQFMQRHELAFESSDMSLIELSANAEEFRNLPHFWNRMLNAGAARDLLRGDMQEHLLFLQKGLSFTHVRFWDIYNPEMMLYDGNAEKHVNFNRLDVIMDFLINHQMHPYLELGPKPVVLMRNVENYLVHEVRGLPFSTREEFSDFTGELLRHYINRYGIEEVEQWYLELWQDEKRVELREYLQIFDQVSRQVKSLCPKIRLGGPGVGMENQYSLRDILALWKNRYARPDFLSVYAYPYHREANIPGDTVSHQRQEEHFLKNYLEECREAAWEAGFGHIEFHLSEWNMSVSSRNIVHDSIYKGAYVVKSLLAMQGKTDLSGYWFGTDLFSEYYDTEHLVNGSGGLISKDRIRKPAYYGVQFFTRLGKKLLACNEDCILTTNLHDSYSIVCHNMRRPSYRYYEKEENEIRVREYQDFFDEESQAFHFRIRGVKDGTYQIKTRLVDQNHGSVLNEWERMGYTDNLNTQDIEYLQQICVPLITMETVEVTGGVLDIRTLLMPNAIEHIHAYRLIE